MKSIHIIAIETGNEAQAIRSVAEHWGADVTVTWCGNSSQIVDFLSSRPKNDLIIIAGHGDSEGLLLPELHESVRNSYPYNERITPGQLREFMDLEGTPVLSLACETGQEPFAKAFLSCGATWYIGPADTPDGTAALMFALDFLYNVIVSGESAVRAHAMASNHSDDRSMFRIVGVES